MIPQKVKNLFDELQKKSPQIQGRYMISEKVDGWYVYTDFHKETGWSHLKSGRGRTIPSLRYYRDEYLNKLPNPRSGCRLIMEAHIPEIGFYELNGLLNRSKGDCYLRGVSLVAHDLVNRNLKDLDAKSRYVRLLGLSDELGKIGIDIGSILAISDSKTKWEEVFKQVTGNGGEGIVLKRSDSIYMPGARNSSLMKMKLIDSVDLMCVGTFLTKGSKGYDALNAEFITGQGQDISVLVPKARDIEAIMKDESFIVGKTCEIQCMGFTPTGKLREPRLFRIRDDV